MTNKAREWDNPLVTGVNRVLTHVPMGAYADETSARTCDRTLSPYVQSLNGTWRFALTDSPTKMPAGFTQENIDDSSWHEISVPGNWQLDPVVDDDPIYTNIAYPFVDLPPSAPEVNPTGWYRTLFHVPSAWAERAIFLLFESCDSACKVWVNGREVGYSQDSKLPHEFEITEYIREGRNTLSVMVPRYCDGFYLECQDYWHLSGIQRDVLLYSKPKTRIRDFSVRTRLDRNYTDATLTIRTLVSDAADAADGFTVEASLYSADGSAVLDAPSVAKVAAVSPMYGSEGEGNMERGSAWMEIPVANPRKWTPETPDLYTLTITLRNANGDAVDFESCRVGFRQVEIRNRVLLLNGKRLVVRGVNRHEHHPRKGRALTVDDMRDEIIAMKRLNFNAVRTSHYPDHPAWYDLCDEYGICVVDEANLETHGIQALTTKDPLWMSAYMERAQRMILRDRNHPSVIIWSLGNESALGPHHAAMAAWARFYDPTRPVQYESGCPGKRISDIMAPMYPQLDWVTKVMSDASETRPMIMCEYAYSKGNANGNFYKYWEMFDKWESFQGGFIWDWADKTLVKRVAGKDEWAYGNEFDGGTGPDGYNYGEKENPQMCMNGVVGPDLVPKPGAIEVKKVQAPVGIACDSDSKLLNGELSIWNKYLALTLDHLEFCWELTASGEVIHSGILSPPSVKPGGKGILRVPFELPEEPAPGVEYWLNVRGRQPEATPWSAPGHVVAWEQFLLPWSAGTRVAPSTERKPVTIVDDGRSVALGAGNTHIVFSKNTGSLSTYKVEGKDLLSRPLEHAFMRAITDNDYIIGNPDSYYKEWEAAGATRLRASVLAFHYGQEKDGCVLLRVTTRHLAEGLKNGISVDSAYWVTSDGRIRIENVVKMDHAFPLVPRIGMQCGIPSGFEKLTWYGRGPHESYCDRKRSAMVGIHASTVVDQFFPFVDPCECGGHEDTRWMELKDAAGSTLKVTGEPVVHFSALHYTREDLMQAGHVYELKGTDNVILAIDGFHMGLGGDTGWTRNVHPEFLLPAGTYRYGFTISGK